MASYIGVDIGTTSTKTIIYSDDAKILGAATEYYPLITDRPDKAEENPDTIFQAVVASIKNVTEQIDTTSNPIKAVSFSVQQHSLMAVDEDGNPLTNILTWADNRSEKIVANLKKNQPELAKKLFENTGVPTHPMAPIFKLAWLKKTSPSIFNKTAQWLGIKEYIFYKLFNRYVTDYSVASSTGFLNLKNLDWDLDAMHFAGISAKQLPELTSSTDFITGINPEYASEMGLPENIKFVLGASDGVLSNIGVGATEEGTLAVTIGTSAAIRSLVDQPLIDAKGRVYCYPILPNKKWIVGGPINNGGVIFRWVRDHLFDDLDSKNLEMDPYDYLTDLAANVPAGANGLLFLPYLEGERAPIWDANARGSFFGMTESHTRADMVRAVLEGIIFNIYSVMLTMREVTGEPKTIMATGGFSRSKVWCQMMADIFETPVHVPIAFESGTLAAMFLAKMALGEAKELSEINQYIGDVTTYKPNPKNFARYRAMMEIFINVTRDLKQDFSAIADYQREFTE
ncbi:gluconate kinase [Weissella coleopterorum]|uniref:Gluconate kinase n=1 Tax=Weissella coleopterorum TaxID=2714949 RepID=A0A6G8B1H3_9LACO|nr:gluconokinase [Weissella coleopterorum]QIL51181.1 gluconate kinase [Weissella coleopterorum]